MDNPNTRDSRVADALNTARKGLQSRGKRCPKTGNLLVSFGPVEFAVALGLLGPAALGPVS